MRYFLLILAFFCKGLCSAQDTAKAYLSPAALFSGEMAEMEGITIKANYREELNEYSYWLSSKDKKINKRVQNEFWAIERNDSLFLNCNLVFRSKKFWPGVYAYVAHRAPRHLHFRAQRVHDPSEAKGLKLFYSQSNPLFTVYTSPGVPERDNDLYDFALGKVVLLDRPTMRKYIDELSSAKDEALINYLNNLLRSP